MKTLAIELRKEKRTGVIPVLLAVGVLGASYAFVNFIVRKDTLLNLPLAPMDVLLTQLYGMIMVLNLFGIVVVTCMIYNVEFKGSAVKKMYMLPVSVPAMYLCKFLILTVMFLVAIVLQNLALAQIGMTDLPDGAFEMGTLVRFAGYSFLTSMPVLSFMLLISSRFENMWVPLGIGVAGFLSGMALANSGLTLLLVHPFLIILKPAVAMSAQPDSTVALVAVVETLLFLAVGLWLAKYSFLTSMPVLSFMLLISSRFENMWVPLGIGVAGFLSGMALANSGLTLLLVHPFLIILKPAVAMSAQPDSTVALVALVETLLFLAVGLWLAKYRRYE